MARPTSWVRTLGEYVDSASLDSRHNLLIAQLTEGQTFGGCRFTWQASHVDSVPSESGGLAVVAGIIGVVAGTSIGSIDGPATAPNSDWIYWEGAFFANDSVYYDGTDAVQVELCPWDQQPRRTQGQRKASDFGTDFYFISESHPGDSPYSDHYLCVSTSVLVIEAP